MFHRKPGLQGYILLQRVSILRLLALHVLVILMLAIMPFNSALGRPSMVDVVARCVRCVSLFTPSQSFVGITSKIGVSSPNFFDCNCSDNFGERAPRIQCRGRSYLLPEIFNYRLGCAIRSCFVKSASPIQGSGWRQPTT